MSVTNCVQQTPPRTLDQRYAALAKANRHRSYRRQMKQDVKRRVRCASDVLASPVAEVETMKVVELLIAMPATGRVKATKMLRMAQIASSKTIGGLSPRQRAELGTLCRAWEARWW